MKFFKFGFVVGIAILLLSTTAFSSQFEGPVVCNERYCNGKLLAPAVRILTIDAFMYGGLVALWPDSFSPSTGSVHQFKKAFTMAPYFNSSKSMFEIDDDPWPLNAVLHPIYGSEAYLSARTWGNNPAVSFLVAVTASLTWEYLMESWFQRPSLIDLAWTPFAGAVIGEFRYRLLTAARKRIDHKVPRTIVMTLLDPLGQLERAMLQCDFAY